MTKMDPMLPEASPSTLKKAGVRRVNNLPLYMVIGAMTIFVFMIALVAFKRANQNKVQEKALLTPHSNTDSSTMAGEVIAGRKVELSNAKIELPPAPKLPESMGPNMPLAIPVAVVENPDEPPLPESRAKSLLDPEIARIRMEKMQAFEHAVKAKTGIEIPAQYKSKALMEKEKLQREIRGNPSSAFQARLEQMRLDLQEIQKDSNDGFELAKEDTDAQQKDRFRLFSQVKAPKPFSLLTGSVIPGTMISEIRSAFPNEIIGQVSQDVYDTATGKYLLIPQGTRIFGISSSKVAFGQDILVVAWQRLIFPDGKTLDIGSMPGADGSGFTGFSDQVDNHYVRIFGSALLMSGIVGGISYSQSLNQRNGFNNQPTAGSVLSEALGQQLGQVTAQMIAKNLNIAPSIKIRPGYQFNIAVIKDIAFTKPYQSFDY